MRNDLAGQRDEPQRGFIVVAALWIILVLATLATVFSVYVSSSAREVALMDSEVQRDALVIASHELTAFTLLRMGEDKRPASGSFQFRMSTADVTVSYTSEAARIDLNLASRKMLAGLFAALGVQPDAADDIGGKIVAWRSRPPADGKATAPPDNANGVDAGSPPPAFSNVRELAFVEGIPPVMVERALPFLTVFSGSENVDPKIAAPQVLAALAQASPSEFGDPSFSLAGATAGQTPADPAAADPAAGDQARAKSLAYRIRTSIRFASGRRTESEAVILLGARHEGEPYRVLSWQDDLPWRDDASELSGS